MRRTSNESVNLLVFIQIRNEHCCRWPRLGLLDSQNNLLVLRGRGGSRDRAFAFSLGMRSSNSRSSSSLLRLSLSLDILTRQRNRCILILIANHAAVHGGFRCRLFHSFFHRL